MAGDWIPVETATPTKAEVILIAHRTGRSRDEVLGLLIRFWIWVSTESDDGEIGLPPSILVDVIGADLQFWQEVAAVGWIEIEGEFDAAERFRVPRADHWITRGGKARLRAKERVRSFRERKQEQPVTVAPLQERYRCNGRTVTEPLQERYTCNGQTVTKPLPQNRTEENRREENILSLQAAEIADIPDCPDIPDDPDIPDGNGGGEDWLATEAAFIARWNQLPGVARHSRNALSASLREQFRRLRATPGWSEAAAQAMKKFPLRNGVVMSLRKFLQDDTVDEIIGGVHDFDSTRSRSRSQSRQKSRPSAGQVYDPDIGCRPPGEF